MISDSRDWQQVVSAHSMLVMACIFLTRARAMGMGLGSLSTKLAGRVVLLRLLRAANDGRFFPSGVFVTLIRDIVCNLWAEELSMQTDTECPSCFSRIASTVRGMEDLLSRSSRS
uniref:Uncharacterized protein n=1 Tax=Ixodes ricinus TaxID=34613 RepID=A0A6B0UL51_IXORI